MTSTRELLTETAAAAADYLESLDERPVGAQASLDDLRATIDVELDEAPMVAGDAIKLVAMFFRLLLLNETNPRSPA